MFPFPALGHVNPMLKLAELLSLSGLRITFLNIHSIHQRLILHTNLQSRFSCFPKFRFQTITDGLPPSYTGGLTKLSHLVRSMETVTKPLLKQMLLSGELGPIPTCIILDGFFSFMVDSTLSLEFPFSVSAPSVLVLSGLISPFPNSFKRVSSLLKVNQSTIDFLILPQSGLIDFR